MIKFSLKRRIITTTCPSVGKRNGVAKHHISVINLAQTLTTVNDHAATTLLPRRASMHIREIVHGVLGVVMNSEYYHTYLEHSVLSANITTVINGYFSYERKSHALFCRCVYPFYRE
jgi:hypothetical protein